MLENLLKEKGFEFVVILENYEEDRTDEISSLLDNKNTTYFFAPDLEEKTNIMRFCEKFGASDLDETKKLIVEKSKKEKAIIVIRNIERLISKDYKAFLTFIKELKSLNVMVVTISKYTAAVKELLEKDLKDVITKTIDNQESNIYDIFSNKIAKPIEAFTYYSVFGSNARYLKYVDANKSVKENLINLILSKDAVFSNEVENILKIELRTLQVYNMILSVIAKGAKTLSDISEQLGLPTSICNKYTTVLINLGILVKVKPVYDADTRKSEYLIKNRLMDFYYYFVMDNLDEISIGKEDRLFDEKIISQIDGYLEGKFSLICREYIIKQIMEEKNLMTVIENGKWWDKNSSIDVVVGNGVKAIFANCYWNENIIGLEEFDKLEKASKNVDVTERKYYLFSKKGFSDELRKIAKSRQDIELVDFNAIFETKRKFLFFK